MTNYDTQQIKAEQFHKLHHSGKMLVFPNVWDTLGAALLESLQYPAVATASASIAFTNDYNDGENMPFNHLLNLLTKIVSSVNIPITADIESGYASNDKQLQENIEQLIATGIVGINIEDTDKATGELISIEAQCHKIRLLKNVSDRKAIPLFINARTDVYIHGNKFETAEAKLEETLKRGLAYKHAGADCFYPIVMRQEQDIKRVIEQLQMPINILTIPGIPELNRLHEIGVARVSLGPSFLKIAIRAMKDIAIQLKDFNGLSEITANEISSDYLTALVNRQY